MKRLWIRIFLAVGACGFVLAQGASAQAANAPAQPSQQTSAPQPDPSNSRTATAESRIAPGSVIPVQLTKTIDAKKVKTGDEVDAKITQDLKSGNGDVVLPKDTKVIGHVTEAQARNKEQKESEVGIAFDHAVMKNGGDVTLPMSIQAIIAPPSANTANNGGGESVSQSPSAPSGGAMSSPNAGGRPSGMGGGMSPQAPPEQPMPAGDSSSNSRAEANANQPITAKTQGVVGISNLQLSTAASAKDGSIVSSEKGNVKLESGTLMLLRVNQ